MTAPQIEKTADSATEGLKDDRELRLDVRQELVAHMEDAVEANRASGMSEDESLAQGLKAFGSSMDIASELMSANASRMRLRQLARIATRALLVPASLLVAFWIYADSLGAARFARGLSSFEFVGPQTDAASVYTRHGMTDKAKFLFFGDTSLDSRLDRQRSIWESDPTNRIYYGNYITILTVEHPVNNMDDLRSLETEIRRGEELDPDNARYNYLLAGLMTEMASELNFVESEDGDERKTVLDVKDRALLDEAMSEMLKGTEKPFMDTYSMEMMALRMGALPKAESLIEVIGRIGFAAGMLLPDLTKHRNLARTSEKYAELLIAEGKEKEAVPVLEAWYPLSRTGFEQGGTLIEALVSFAIARLGSNSVPLLVAIGEDERADRMKRLSEAANGVYDVWKARMKSDDNDMDDIVMRHGSILHAMLLPSIGSEGVTKEDMAPGREIEQTWMEKGWLSAFISLLMLIMLGFFAISIFMRFSRGGESAPLLLLPDAGQMLRVILFSVVIPLAVFFVYARHTDLSGRDLSIRYWPRFVTELHLLSVVMLSVAAYQMQKLVDSRCRYLGLETPGARKWWQIFLLTLIPVGLIVWLASGCRKTALFRGTVARSLIPILAIVIILVGSMAHPHLVKRERTLVQADSILSIPDEGGFTRIENEVAKQLTREALAAMDAAEQELE